MNRWEERRAVKLSKGQQTRGLAKVLLKSETTISLYRFLLKLKINFQYPLPLKVSEMKKTDVGTCIQLEKPDTAQ